MTITEIDEEEAPARTIFIRSNIVPTKFCNGQHIVLFLFDKVILLANRALSTLETENDVSKSSLDGFLI